MESLFARLFVPLLAALAAAECGRLWGSIVPTATDCTQHPARESSGALAEYPFICGVQEVAAPEANSPLRIFAYTQPSGGWCWSNGGLIVDTDARTFSIIDAATDVRLTQRMVDAYRPLVRGYTPKFIILTHADIDHIYGLDRLATMGKFEAVVAHEATALAMSKQPNPHGNALRNRQWPREGGQAAPQVGQRTPLPRGEPPRGHMVGQAAATSRGVLRKPQQGGSLASQSWARVTELGAHHGVGRASRSLRTAEHPQVVEREMAKRKRRRRPTDTSPPSWWGPQTAHAAKLLPWTSCPAPQARAGGADQGQMVGSSSKLRCRTEAERTPFAAPSTQRLIGGALWRSFLALPEHAEEASEEEEEYVYRARTVRIRAKGLMRRRLCDAAGAAKLTYNLALEAHRNGAPCCLGVLARHVVAGKRCPKNLNGGTLARWKDYSNDRDYGAPPLDEARQMEEWQEVVAAFEEDDKAWRAEAAAGNFDNAHQRAFPHGAVIRTRDYLSAVPYPIRQNAVRDLLKANEACKAKARAQAERGDKVSKWKLHFRSRKKMESWTFLVDKKHISKVEVCGKHTKLYAFAKFFGGPLVIPEVLPHNALEDGSLVAGLRITRDRLGRFHAHVLQRQKKEELPELPPVSMRRVVALDPGVRTFQTAYSPSEGVIEYGTSSSTTRFQRQLAVGKMEDRLEQAKRVRALSKLAHRIGSPQTRLALDGGMNGDIPYEKRRSLNARIQKQRAKLKQEVNEYHRSTIADLLKSHETVLLPTFEVQGMVRKSHMGKKRRINGTTVARMLGWSHFLFKQRLLAKGKWTGKEISIVNEAYTTKTCGRCGRRREVGGARTYTCEHCGLCTGRDTNGARNVLLKHVSPTALGLLALLAPMAAPEAVPPES